MGERKQPLSAAEVLGQALAAAQEASSSQRLYDVKFWMYAATGEGWGWSLQFLSEVSNRGVETGEDPRHRVLRVAATWAEQMRKQQFNDNLGDEGGHS